ncbi:DUF4148 domain-containing protein [Paraburkholderia nodosa]|uniref:DUF4148 domain-containing protein n=1 Tax=Paraburkholderia nodosa TaxID=392320 RepID=UPI0004B598F2|nr:DUF4148 domain-containing protein [Paraburkholderia nodosa]
MASIEWIRKLLNIEAAQTSEGSSTVKNTAKAFIATIAFSLPILALAQTASTRAQVKSDLAQVEKSGYNPTGSDLQYPDNLMTAETRLAKAKTANASAQVQSAYGGVVNAVSVSGSN